MKSIISKFPWSELSLPTVTVLAVAVILFPASQFAVLGLLRATQMGSTQSVAQQQPLDLQDELAGSHGFGELEMTQRWSAGDDSRNNPLAAMASAVHRERRAGEFLATPNRPPPGGPGSKPESLPTATRFQGYQPAFSAALSSVFAQASKGPDMRVETPPLRETVSGTFAIEFVALPLSSTSALRTPFVLDPAGADGGAWSLMHPDFASRGSNAALRITLSRTLGH